MRQPPFTGTSRDQSAEPSQPSEEAPAIRIDWRIAIGIAAALAILFASQNGSAVLGFRQSFSSRLTAQALQWGIWLALLPLVFSVAQRAHRYRVTDWRNVTFQVAACVGIAVLH